MTLWIREQARPSIYIYEVLRYIKTILFWVKRLKEIAKCCLNWIVFSWCPYVVLGAQILNTRMKYSKLINKSIAQKVMAKHTFDSLLFKPMQG